MTADEAGLPPLRRGRHSDPGAGMCLMEFVSLASGDGFSDRPRCTHPALAALARGVNDRVSDRARPWLARLAPALRGTGMSCPGAAEALTATCARRALELAPGHRRSRAVLATAGSAPVDHRRCTEEPMSRRRLRRTEMAVFDALGAIVEAVQDRTRRDEILVALLCDVVAAHRRRCPQLDDVAVDLPRLERDDRSVPLFA